MGSDVNQNSEFAREASDEERAFHAAQSSAGDGGNRESREAPAADFEPKEPREAREPRESRSEGGSQAPLDLPPPPASKPFVVWSSTPDGTSDRRDD